MTTYDPPAITNPENVDALTHQQIYDAFQTVAQSCGDVVTAWQQAGSQWRTSTTGLVKAVRSAVDGHWSGASADAAVNALVDYGNQAGNLADLFDAAGQVVTNTAQAALTTKSYIPKPVPVSADQTKDPSGFDRQTRDANKAQDEARQIMQQRYVLPFTEQDKKIPTFPDAMPIAGGDGTGPASTSAFDDQTASTESAAWTNGSHRGFTTPASVTSLLHDLPLPASADSEVSRFLPDSPTSTASEVLYQQPEGSRLSRFDRDEGALSSSDSRPSHTTPSDSAPTALSSPHDTDSPLTAMDGDHHDSPSQQANPIQQQSNPDHPRVDSDHPEIPAQTDTHTAGTHADPSSDGVRPEHDSMTDPPAGGSSPGSTPTPSAGPSVQVPGTSTPNPAGPALGSAGSIPAVPTPVPSAPAPNTPTPGVPTPVPSTPVPAPSPIAPAPNPSVVPAPNVPVPAPNIQAPAPGTSAPQPSAPKSVPNTPAPGTGAHAPAAAQPAPDRTTVGPLPPDVLAEPAAAAVTGAATTEVMSDPGHHHTGEDHRPPRLRVRFEGDRDRVGKVDLRHESHSAEMAGRDEHVQPTIGE